MAEMTPTQGRYLSYIRAYIDGFDLSPSETEMAEAIGVTPPAVNQMMKTLEKKGFIRRQPDAPRSIEILVADDAIPKWRGKRITRTVWQWTYDPPKKRHRRDASDKKVTVYQFKIVLKDTHPVIWRRIETADVTLEALNELIQTAMGWTNSHTHQFEIANKRYTHPRFIDSDDDYGETDYTGIRVSDLVAELGPELRIGYEYDLGDGWRHDVVLEKVTESEPGVSYPRCTAGKRACPPEDVGGVGGFEDYVDAITDPDHREHKAMLRWNGPFDPASFDAAKATQRMKKGLPSW